MPSAQAMQAACELIDREFGIGRDFAHMLIRSDVGARRIHDCAVMALGRVLDVAMCDPKLRVDLGSASIGLRELPDGSIEIVP